MALISLFALGSCHKQGLRETVGSQVVRVTREDGKSGGTGVHVVSPSSGKVYLLTNKHICREADKDGVLWVGFDEGRSIPRHVLEMSKNSDLCLMEPLPDMSGVPLASDGPKPFDAVSIWGHPLLQPLSEAKGRSVGYHEITVLQFVIDSEEKKLQCNGSNESIQEIDMFIIKMDMCMSKSTSDLSDAQIYPGNSGSPVVNTDGKLIGVVYASSSETHWSESVPLSDVRGFLLPY